MPNNNEVPGGMGKKDSREKVKIVDDRRIRLRRVLDRQFWRCVVRSLVILNIVVLFGGGYEINRVTTLNEIMVNDNLRHEKTLDLLVHDMRAGERFTAGNAWQLAQLTLLGVVNMDTFPDGLTYPSGTWFHNWLCDNDLLINSSCIDDKGD